MGKLTIGPVRISYAHVFEPRAAQAGQKAKYGASLLIPKTAKQTYAQVLQAIEGVKADYKSSNPKAGWINQPKLTLHDGDGNRPSGEEFGQECKGHWVLGTSSVRQPMVVDQAKNPILDQNEVYSGCYCLAVINFYAYDTAGNKGIACGLEGLMKVRDGDKLGGGGVTNKDWDNVAANDLQAAVDALLG